MGRTVLIPSQTPTELSAGIEGGSIFISVALAYLLAYLYLLDAMDETKDKNKMAIAATILPLAVAFSIIVLYQAAQVL